MAPAGFIANFSSLYIRFKLGVSNSSVLVSMLVKVFFKKDYRSTVKTFMSLYRSLHYEKTKKTVL